MKICYLGDAGSPHLVKWVQHAAARGFDPVVLSSTPSAMDRVETIYCPPQKTLRQLWQRQLDIIRAVRPDIVHAHFVDQFALVTQWAGVPAVLTPWGSDVYAPFPDRFSGLNRTVKWYLLRRAYRRAAAVTALSPHMRERLLGHFGATMTNCHALGFGRQMHEAISMERKEEVRRNCGGAARVVLFSPRACKPLYNIASIVEAFLTIVPDYPDACLWVNKFNAEEDYLSAIETIAKSSPFCSRICFLDGCPSDVVQLRIAASDLILSVPDSDGRPITVIDSLSCGVPVVYKDLPQLTDLLVDGFTGISVADACAANIGSAIRRFLDMHADQRARMSDQCRQSVRSIPGEEEEMDRMAYLYRQIARERSNGNALHGRGSNAKPR